MYEVGYNGMSLRDIAAELDVALSTLYHSFESKQEILHAFLNCTFDKILTNLQRALLLAPARPEAQLAALVDAYVRPQFESQWGRVVASTAHAEFDQLGQPWRQDVDFKRSECRRLFEIVVNHGVREHAFHTAYPSDACRAILTIAATATDMYDDDEVADVNETVHLFTDLALQLVDYEPVPARGTA